KPYEDTHEDPQIKINKFFELLRDALQQHNTNTNQQRTTTTREEYIKYDFLKQLLKNKGGITITELNFEGHQLPLYFVLNTIRESVLAITKQFFKEKSSSIKMPDLNLIAPSQDFVLSMITERIIQRIEEVHSKEINV